VICLAGQLSRQEQSLAAPAAARSTSRLLAIISLARGHSAVAEYDLRAALGKQQRGRLADPGACSGDGNDLSSIPA
jgi:hypothetical protein